MSTVTCGAGNIGEELTIDQRMVLRTTLRAARLVRVQRGVVAVNIERQALAMPFPVRTLNALARGGYVEPALDGDGWVLSAAGAQVGGQR